MISETERDLYEKMQIPLILFSVSGDELRAELISDGLCRIAKIERKLFLELLNGDLYLLVHPDDRAWMKRDIDNFIHKMNDLDVVFRNKTKNGIVYRMVHAIGEWQEMQDGTEMVCIAYYEMMDPEGKLGKLFSYPDHTREELLFRDSVTGLPNLGFLRQFSNERLQILRSCEKTPVLLYCDVKSLHEYNAQYGYARGDELMRLYASLLKEMFPEAMIARGADDHFVVIDAFTNETDIVERIKRIHEKSRKMAFGIPRILHVGICLVEPDMDAAKAMDCGRQAMKEIGDDLSTIWNFYSPKRDEQYWKERYILDNHERALENGWIKVFYQGIVRVGTEKMTMLEALSRWIDPVHGMISPGDFIPVLSRYHLLYKLDLYMAEHVCREFHEREKAGLPLIPVTVNFSAQDFDYVEVAEKLNELTERCGLSHDKIIVEITEQDIARGTEHFRSEIKKIRDNGYKLWIDDFGSGYSSLNVFSRFDIDRIKFDMELLRHLDDNNGANRRILRSFISICREMGVHTLAEGVETAEQLRFLREIDCEMAQGFYFYKPEPLETAIHKFRTLGSAIPHETSEERESVCKAWLMA